MYNFDFVNIYLAALSDNNKKWNPTSSPLFFSNEDNVP